MRVLRMHSLGFPVYHAAVLTLVITLHVTPLVLVYLITGRLLPDCFPPICNSLPLTADLRVFSQGCMGRLMGSPCSSAVNNLLATQEMWVQSLGREDPLDKEMATHSSILAWWGAVHGVARVRHNLATKQQHNGETRQHPPWKPHRRRWRREGEWWGESSALQPEPREWPQAVCQDPKCLLCWGSCQTQPHPTTWSGISLFRIITIYCHCLFNFLFCIGINNTVNN